MAFKIIHKFKSEQIKSRNLDTSFLDKYYKGVQKLLLQKTDVEKTTEYFFCENYTADEHLFIIGTPSSAHKKLFKSAGKGGEGFDKTKISIGTCFILDEDGNKVLCLLPNLALARGKKASILKTLKKMQRTSLKLIDEIRWLDAPLMVDAQDSSKIESVVDPVATGDSGTPKQAIQISEEDIVAKSNDLKRAIEKLVKDVMPRYKKRETTDSDAAFVKALRKAGYLFLAQLPQADENTQNRLAAQKKRLETGLPQWKELEARIHSQKGENTGVSKQSLLKVIKTMNERRDEIKAILKRTNIKTLG